MSPRPLRRPNDADDGENMHAPGFDYANQFEVGFSRDEVLVSMAQAYEGVTTRARPTRVVMTPAYAKALLMLLGEAMSHYEAEYGAVLAAGAGVVSQDEPH